ncbi:3723_t:CDS:1, partial [Dentiscutata erythropus]
DYLDLKYGLSYRKLSEIGTFKNPFTKEQSDLIKSKKKLSWSVAVSDRLMS